MITPDQIRHLRTLATGQCCDLKIHVHGERRVWLCRVAGGVTVEEFDPLEGRGRWEVTRGGCRATEGA